MVSTRRMLALLSLGSAMVARPVLGQLGSSVSLTHTVSVTVPPRVKVQIGTASSAIQTGFSPSAPSDGLAVSVNATQAWTLSIGSVNGSSKVQWSTDRSAGFSSIGRRDATIASGEISSVPTLAMVFFRNEASASAGQSRSASPDAVILTVVAP